jgi:hypothetical protein
MSALVTDGASVNDVLASSVSKALLTLYGIPDNPGMHISCFAHIINLVVQDVLGALDELDDDDKVVVDGGANDHFRLHKDEPAIYNPAQDQDLQGLEVNREKEMAAMEEDSPVTDEEMHKVLQVLVTATSEQEVAAVGTSKLKRVRSMEPILRFYLIYACSCGSS